MRYSAHGRNARETDRPFPEPALFVVNPQVTLPSVLWRLLLTALLEPATEGVVTRLSYRY
jgi:hypothetical protein